MGGEIYDDTLTQCVYQLRRHLVAAGGGNKYRKLIETKPKRGYLLNSDVSPPDAPGPRPAVARRSATWWSIGLLVLLVTITGGWWFSDRTGSRAYPVRAVLQGSEILPNSVAVLPFVDLSPEQDQKYFADGISEELHTIASRVARYLERQGLLVRDANKKG